MLLTTIEITGAAAPQPFQELFPIPSHPNEMLVLFFDGFTSDITLIDGNTTLRIPADASQPFPYSPVRAFNVPEEINVADGDSVTVTVQVLS